MEICDALHDLVPFVKFKKHHFEKHPWRSVNFRKVAGSLNFNKINTPPWVFFKMVFFKFYKWYQIALCITYFKVFFYINPLHFTGLFLYPLKRLDILRFSNILWEQRKGTVASNHPEKFIFEFVICPFAVRNNYQTRKFNTPSNKRIYIRYL